jgi:ribonuclease HI
MAKKKFYVVWEGVEPGIYDSWAACQVQIKGYPNAKYKSYPSREAAEDAYLDGPSFTKKGNSKSKTTINPDHPDITWKSISVDAACSGNPGVMEYQGVDTATKYQYFHQKFELGTNNIGEFLAIVHALAMLKKENNPLPIYTDSKIAQGWVAKKKCKTTLPKTAKTKKLYELIIRAENWLKTNSYENKILKWDTKNWGEIPADFGRK